VLAKKYENAEVTVFLPLGFRLKLLYFRIFPNIEVFFGEI
jgi:hypothetical protein